MGWVPLSKTVLQRNKKSEHIPNLENVVRIFLVCVCLPKKMQEPTDAHLKPNRNPA